MIQLRPSAERGYADHGWLRAKHSFSFANYYDPAEMGWGALRVINEDRVAPGQGFGTHGHRDMEIVTYILSGALEHKDSLGHGGVIRRGEVQRMSAGKGIMHSEFNPLPDEETHLLQIWIEPAQRGTRASYEQQALPVEEMRGRWRLVASPDGAEGSTTIGQDARLWASVLAPGERAEYRLAAGRLGYVQVVSGQLSINGQNLAAGDGAKIADETQLEFLAGEETEILLFDLPPVA
ncbi:pirin family protein [Ferribacterium limneticum]|uniref:pirin family protein n=1 Tax=Ferribacterium limneticum TaxID=76259 RepID=UPI001CFB4885|nr:pirin family protein [Ferribacterium limneticum]UCV29083.1 pirin family protein [Ferribacterium limneticum]UCV33001.1 pirin family protein [Ferribacterium limneticum]